MAKQIVKQVIFTANVDKIAARKAQLEIDKLLKDTNIGVKLDVQEALKEGKTLQEAINGMFAEGIDLKLDPQAAEKLKSELNVIADNFTAMTQSFNQMGSPNAFNSLARNFQMMGKSSGDLTSQLRGATSILNTMTKDSFSLIQPFKDMGSALSNSAGNIKSLVTGAKGTGDAMKVAGVAAKGFGASLAAATGGITLLVAGVAALINHLNNLQTEKLNQYAENAKKAAEEQKKATQEIIDAGKASQEVLKTKRKEYNEAKEHYDNLKKSFDELVKNGHRLSEAAKTELEARRKTAEALRESRDNIANALKENVRANEIRKETNTLISQGTSLTEQETKVKQGALNANDKEIIQLENRLEFEKNLTKTQRENIANEISRRKEISAAYKQQIDAVGTIAKKQKEVRDSASDWASKISKVTEEIRKIDFDIEMTTDLSDFQRLENKRGFELETIKLREKEELRLAEELLKKDKARQKEYEQYKTLIEDRARKEIELLNKTTDLERQKLLEQSKVYDKFLSNFRDSMRTLATDFSKELEILKSSIGVGPLPAEAYQNLYNDFTIVAKQISRDIIPKFSDTIRDASIKSIRDIGKDITDSISFNLIQAKEQELRYLLDGSLEGFKKYHQLLDDFVKETSQKNLQINDKLYDTFNDLSENINRGVSYTQEEFLRLIESTVGSAKFKENIEVYNKAWQEFDEKQIAAKLQRIQQGMKLLDEEMKRNVSSLDIFKQGLIGFSDSLSGLQNIDLSGLIGLPSNRADIIRGFDEQEKEIKKQLNRREIQYEEYEKRILEIQKKRNAEALKDDEKYYEELTKINARFLEAFTSPIFSMQSAAINEVLQKHIESNALKKQSIELEKEYHNASAERKEQIKDMQLGLDQRIKDNDALKEQNQIIAQQTALYAGLSGMVMSLNNSFSDGKLDAKEFFKSVIDGALGALPSLVALKAFSNPFAAIGAVAGLSAILLALKALLSKNKFAEGGFVSGAKGKDKIPAMLTHGEYVIPADITTRNLPSLERLRYTGQWNNTQISMAGVERRLDMVVIAINKQKTSEVKLNHNVKVDKYKMIKGLEVERLKRAF